MSTSDFVPAGVQKVVWNEFVFEARECITGWLDHSGITVKVWNDLCSGTIDSWMGHDADDWRYSFAVNVLDQVDPDMIDQSILDAFIDSARDEGRYTDDSSNEDIAYACAEVAWNEAVWAAEDLLA